MIEHGLQPDACYPTQDTFFHASSDSSLQIDYFLVGPSGMCLQITVTIPEIHHLNLSDHTNLESHINTAAPRAQASSEKSSRSKCVLHSRIKWNKCDLSLCKAVVSESLAHGSSEVECTLDAELIVRSITSTLCKASETSCAEPKKRKSKKGLPIWGDQVATAVHGRKVAHSEWKRAGCLRDPENPSFKQRKEAHKVLKRAVRFTLFQQRQDLLVSVMDASEHDAKLFYRLVTRQCARPSTATEILQFNGSTLVGAEEIAAGFSSHFRDLATPTPNESFDSEYFRQVQYDALVIEDLCSRQVGCTFKSVETAEIFSIIRSFRNGKAQDIHGLSAEHLKHAVEIVALPLANLLLYPDRAAGRAIDSSPKERQGSDVTHKLQGNNCALYPWEGP